jgi:hypothetical protein
MLTFRNPAAALAFEIGQERASALGRQGQRLETALAVLRAYDSARPQEAAAQRSDRERARLVADAGEALWYLMVQRDACGLYGTSALIADYGVPREVLNRAGPSPYEDVPGRLTARKPAASVICTGLPIRPGVAFAGSMVIGGDQSVGSA